MVGDYSSKMGVNQLRYDSKWCFGAMLFLVWTRFTAYAYMIAVLKKISIFNPIADYIYPFAIFMLILLAFPYIRQRMGMSEIVVYILTLVALMVSMLFNENNAFYIERELQEILMAIVPMVFLGVCYYHDSHKRVLFWASAICVLSSLLSQIYIVSSGRALAYDSMGTAYRVLPSAMYLIYWAFEKKKLKFWVLAAIGIGLEFIFGTRGPILCMGVYLSVGFLLTSFKKKSGVYKLIVILIVVALTVFLASGDALVQIAKWFSEIFEEWGVSTRIFDYYLRGDINELSGRDSLADRAWMAIAENAIIGYGIMGDRTVLRGTYAHNLFLELWLHYGMILGTVLIVAILRLTIKAFRTQYFDGSFTMFLWMITTMVYVKLMVSSSYIIEEYFFFALGLFMAAIRNKNEAI